MNAPDKIYLERSLSFPDKFHRHWYKEDVVGGGEEYIRKEALMEWLENKVSLSYGVATDALVEVIDKLNSL